MLRSLGYSCFYGTKKPLTRFLSSLHLDQTLDRQLKRFYLLVHPDMMSGYPESVKITNDECIKTLNAFLETSKPYLEAESGDPVSRPEEILFNLKFIAKSQDAPADFVKSQLINFSIRIPPYLYSAPYVGPIFRKKWAEFVSDRVYKLCHVSGLLTQAEYLELTKNPKRPLWNGNVASLLFANQTVLEKVQDEMVKTAASMKPEDFMSPKKVDHIRRLKALRSGLEYLMDQGHVLTHGLSSVEREAATILIRKSLYRSAKDLNLDSPIWKHVCIHIHRGPYKQVQGADSSFKFHVYVPHTFISNELKEFLLETFSLMEKRIPNVSVPHHEKEKGAGA